MWGLMFMLGMALVSGFASVPGVRYSAVPQEVGPPCPQPVICSIARVTMHANAVGDAVSSWIMPSKGLTEPGRIEAVVPGGADTAMLAQVVYSEFLDLVNTGNVRQARIDESLQKVYFSVRPLQQAGQQDAPAEASTSGGTWVTQDAVTRPDTCVQGVSLCGEGLALHIIGGPILCRFRLQCMIDMAHVLQACQQRGQLCCSGCRRTLPRTL